MTRARDLADIIGPNGDLVVTGDLQVTGTTTTVNSTTVEIADNNILLGSGATTNAQNTGAGLSVLLPDASPDEFATLVYTTSSDSWSFNKNVGIGTTAPGESLHLRAAAPAIRFEDTDVSGVNQIYSNGSEFVISADQSDLDAFSKITFLVDGDPKASIYDSGTLAIGSGASSNYVLTTNYDANATFSNAVSDFTQMWQNSGVNMLGVAGADDLTVRLAVNNGYVLAFNNGVTEAFRITTAGNIEAPSASSGNFEIGIEDNATDTFRTSAKGLIIKGNDAFTGGSPQQASAGGDVEVRAGYGVDNTGIGAFAGDLTLSGGIPFSGNNSGAGQIFLKTNNTEVLTVSRDQKVGIGTTNPAEPLTISYFDKDPGIQLERGDGTPATLRIDHNSIRTLTNTDIQIFTNGNNPQIFLDQSSGNVGIGSTSPGEKLHVEGSVLIDAFNMGDEEGIFFREGFSDTNKYNVSIMAKDHNGSSADGLSINGYDGVSFCTGSNNRNEVMRIVGGNGSDVGNVGIGTTNPGTKLHVDGAITHKELTSVFSGGGGANANYYKIFSKSFSSSSSFATNNYRVSITLGGETGGKIGFAEFDVGFKQQSSGDFFEIVPFRSAYCDVGYTWDVNGGSESSGLLEIYISAGNFYMYFDVQVQARGAPSSSLEGWEFTDTGSGTPPAGMISMTFNQESKGILYSQAGLDIEPIQLGAPFDSTVIQVANGTEQATTSDSSTFPATTTAASITFDSDTYNQGSYRTEFAKIDRSGNLPLYVRNSLGGTTQTNIARFGTHAYSTNSFEVFGDTKVQGAFASDGESSYQNGVLTRKKTFTVPASVNRRIRVTCTNYTSVRVRISALRTNSGDSIVWWEGYVNNNDNTGYATAISSRSSSGTINYTFTNNGNGTFDWDFNNTTSPGMGTITLEDAANSGSFSITETTW